MQLLGLNAASAEGSGTVNRPRKFPGKQEPVTSPENNRVRFIRSFTDAEKRKLLEECSAVVYTPSHEHFGIVPIETMAAMRPVIAVNNGGPLESVADGETGFLCPPTAEVRGPLLWLLWTVVPPGFELSSYGTVLWSSLL